MIKLTVKDIVDGRQALEKLYVCDLPVLISFSLAKNLKKINEICTSFDQIKMKLFDKYGEIDEKDKNMKRIKDEHIDKYNEEMTTLFKEEIELDLDLISIKDLTNIKMTPMDLVYLEKLVKYQE